MGSLKLRPCIRCDPENRIDFKLNRRGLAFELLILLKNDRRFFIDFYITNKISFDLCFMQWIGDVGRNIFRVEIKIDEVFRFEIVSTIKKYFYTQKVFFLRV